MTGVVQASRAASGRRSTPDSAGAHLTKQRLGPSPTSNIRPPISLLHTARQTRPAATAATTGSICTAPTGPRAIIRPGSHEISRRIAAFREAHFGRTSLLAMTPKPSHDLGTLSPGSATAAPGHPSGSSIRGKNVLRSYQSPSALVPSNCIDASFTGSSSQVVSRDKWP